MSWWDVAYLGVGLALALYGLNMAVLLVLYGRYRREGGGEAQVERWPVVTVQVPLYNEPFVAERVIHAVARLDYPRDRLEIQVLDDSTDGSGELVQRAVDRCRRQGVDIHLIRREGRDGYKAGALAVGLREARGELIAIFDADFVPPRDFLRRTVPCLMARPDVGFVQARWGHLNAERSWLTRAQAMALDGHFVVEQTARCRSGCLIGFNGTAGVWRRACIESVGGWQGDTLAEDLDLSYRAQMAGWRGLFLPDVEAPAELPVQLGAFKRQQFRWAKGATQCLLKLGGRLWCSRVPWWAKVEGTLHMSGYVAQGLMVALLLVQLPVLMRGGRGAVWLMPLTLAPVMMYVVSQFALYPRPWRRLVALPVLLALGMGVALNNTVAVVEALLGQRSPFLRTPKVGEGGRGVEDVRFDPLVLGEGALAVYALLCAAVAWRRGMWGALPFLALYVAGFGWVAWQGVVEWAQGVFRGMRGWQRRREEVAR